jgi:hypothetical protein
MTGRKAMATTQSHCVQNYHKIWHCVGTARANVCSSFPYLGSPQSCAEPLVLCAGTWAAATLTAPCASITPTRHAPATKTSMRRMQTTRSCVHAVMLTCMWSCTMHPRERCSQHRAWRCRWVWVGRWHRHADVPPHDTAANLLVEACQPCGP